MRFLYQQLQLNDEDVRRLIGNAAKELATVNPEEYGNNYPAYIKYPLRLSDDFEEGLRALESMKIINYFKNGADDKESSYTVVVTNRYAIERLAEELHWLDSQKVKQSIFKPNIENLVYYDMALGRVIINGNERLLKKSNKKLFDLLYVANPNTASREELLKVLRLNSRGLPSKVALNEAFTNLRKICGVDSDSISLTADGGKLKARTYLLSAQLPLDYMTE